METENKKRGFRLRDIIIVAIILIVLAGIIIPELQRPNPTPARRVQCDSNLKLIGFELIGYAHEHEGKYPDKLSKLYPDYIPEKEVFRCPSDKLVTKETNASITAGVPFTKNQCSYGYDNTHTQGDGPDIALVADRPPTIVDDINNSPNHVRKTADGVSSGGQNITYIDGHVEYVTSPLAGWYDENGKRDNIYVDNSTEGTDTYIRHDGK